MPVYAYGIKRNPLYWQGNKIGKAYRYGNLVFQSFQWSQSSFTSMGVGRVYAASAVIPNANVFLIAGGSTTGNVSDKVDTVETYTEAGVRTTVTELRNAVQQLAGAGCGSKAFFAGGAISSLSNFNEVYMYDSLGTRTVLSSLNSNVRANASAIAGNYVLFSGGQISLFSGRTAAVYAYDQNGTKTRPSDMAAETMFHIGATCDGYAFFGYGYDGSTYRLNVSIYDSSTVRVATVSGTETRSELTATKCGNGVIFIGGVGASSAYRNSVEHFTTSGVRTTLSPLSGTRYRSASGTLNGMAVVAGGQAGSDTVGVTIVEVYNASGVKTTTTLQLTNARYLPEYATLNNTLYIIGGRHNGSTLTAGETISYK